MEAPHREPLAQARTAPANREQSEALGSPDPGPSLAVPSASLVSLLREAYSERDRLQHELQQMQSTLADTHSELKSLWDLLTSRTVPRGLRYAGGNPAQFARLTPETEERARIRAQILRVRTLARRRRWSWIPGLRGGA